MKKYIGKNISIKISVRNVLVMLNQQCMQEYLYSHFESEGHNGFLEDVSITIIDKTDGSNPTKRETFWMHTLKTLAPYGLNVENGI